MWAFISGSLRECERQVCGEAGQQNEEACTEQSGLSGAACFNDVPVDILDPVRNV